MKHLFLLLACLPLLAAAAPQRVTVSSQATVTAMVEPATMTTEPVALTFQLNYDTGVTSLDDVVFNITLPAGFRPAYNEEADAWLVPHADICDRRGTVRLTITHNIDDTQAGATYSISGVNFSGYTFTSSPLRLLTLWVTADEGVGQGDYRVLTSELVYDVGEGHYVNTSTTTAATIHYAGRLAESIELSKPSMDLKIGRSAVLTATVLPESATNRSVSWVSSNPSVATVDGSGRVTGVAHGLATVTATTRDGSGLSAQCRVLVDMKAGDVNADDRVDVTDVNLCVNVLLGKTSNELYRELADVNGDGQVDVSDMNRILNIILGKDILPPPSGGTAYTVNGVTFYMIPVEGGTFTMGATAEQGSDAIDWEKPAHEVTLSDYAIGQTEVTQELWVAVMGDNPSWFNGYGNSDYGSYHSDYNYGTNRQRPVECVSWDDCQTFIAKLNALTGETFRLPTEAEWEYAARGGQLSEGHKYAGSDDIDKLAWFRENCYEVDGSYLTKNDPDYGSHSVATKAPNELGLYDMSGNVWEWCADRWGWYNSNAVTNPTGPTTGSIRVCRGGCWLDDAGCCRVSFRNFDSPTNRDDNLGLRLGL